MLTGLLGAVAFPHGLTAGAQTARDVLGAASVQPLANEPPAKIIIDPPLAESLSHGRVVIQYRTENLHIVPVFGAASLAVSPRIGQVHVTVDDNQWVWADASGDPVVLNGLQPGPPKVRVQLQTANHQLLDQGSIGFTVPAVPMAAPTVAATPWVPQSEPPAKVIIDAPLAEALSRGVYSVSAENLQLVPVYGSAAVGVSPRVGHIHVTVDDVSWHWADASGNSIILQGLSPGPHKVRIQLVNANQQPVDEGIVSFVIPNTHDAHSHC